MIMIKDHDNHDHEYCYNQDDDHDDHHNDYDVNTGTNVEHNNKNHDKVEGQKQSFFSTKTFSLFQVLLLPISGGS